MTVLGFDSRHWDGNLPSPTPFRYAFVKFTEATGFTASTARQQWDGLKARNLLRGPYHFYRNAANPEDQAAFFRATVGSDIGELPPVLDLEDTASIKGGELPARVKRCLAEIERLFERKPMIYSAAWWWNPWMGTQAWATAYEHWVANYTAGSVPLLPVGWGRWDVWQYKGDVAEPGMNAMVDWNRCSDEWFAQYESGSDEVTLSIKAATAADLRLALQ